MDSSLASWDERTAKAQWLSRLAFRALSRLLRACCKRPSAIAFRVTVAPRLQVEMERSAETYRSG